MTVYLEFSRFQRSLLVLLANLGLIWAEHDSAGPGIVQYGRLSAAVNFHLLYDTFTMNFRLASTATSDVVGRSWKNVQCTCSKSVSRANNNPNPNKLHLHADSVVVSLAFNSVIKQRKNE
mmetsp:Transcript_20501/g.32115  ORF Transcript_20501/g.32115 Transcript_20501/m.32115 type:complete len:120 (-) Transcript_20501:9-368(-)